MPEEVKPEAVRIMHAPSHGPTLDFEAVRHALLIANKNRVHSIGYTEAYNQIPVLSSRPFWSIVVGESKTDKRRGPKDNPILVSRYHAEIVDSGAYKACGSATPIRIAPERWNTWVVYRTNNGQLVLHIAVHPHAGVQNARITSARVRGFFLQWFKVERLVKRLRKRFGDKLLVVISGDMNATSAWKARYAPASVFRRLDLRVSWRHIDAIAYDKRLKLVKLEEITNNNQDHPWLVATFERGLH